MSLLAEFIQLLLASEKTFLNIFQRHFQKLERDALLLYIASNVSINITNKRWKLGYKNWNFIEKDRRGIHVFKEQ